MGCCGQLANDCDAYISVTLIAQSDTADDTVTELMTQLVSQSHK